MIFEEPQQMESETETDLGSETKRKDRWRHRRRSGECVFSRMRPLPGLRPEDRRYFAGPSIDQRSALLSRRIRLDGQSAKGKTADWTRAQ